MSTPLAWFTAFHTLLSLVAIVVGFWAIRDLMVGRVRSGALSAFLVTAILTSVTGFFFPFHGFTPAIGVGIVALVVLAWTLAARRSIGRSGFWTAQFPLGIVISEYFLMFVLVAQIFAKVPALAALPPDLQKKLFGASQLVVLVVFVVLAIRTTRSFRVRAIA
ncbi:hypothetical protein [Dyella sp. C11]|uniref:hypothetical protein n=1 Tax=Dyella sp. C11 TaxID=2126991 RepID=UPI000D65BE09|nr:hypothetical protein [Dyella sp. C11]